MNKQELMYLAQKNGLNASKLTNLTHTYITEPSETNKFNLIKMYTSLIGGCNYAVEEIHREEFARQITEHVQAVEKRTIDAR